MESKGEKLPPVLPPLLAPQLQTTLQHFVGLSLPFAVEFAIEKTPLSAFLIFVVHFEYRIAVAGTPFVLNSNGQRYLHAFFLNRVPTNKIYYRAMANQGCILSQ